MANLNYGFSPSHTSWLSSIYQSGQKACPSVANLVSEILDLVSPKDFGMT